MPSEAASKEFQIKANPFCGQRLVPSVFFSGEIFPFFDKEIEKILDFFFFKVKIRIIFLLKKIKLSQIFDIKKSKSQNQNQNHW